MELRQLRTFIEVAECGSLTHAAERLHMVQPTLSRQIKLLEDEFGLALFERQSRGMKPTEAGQRLLERGRAILREVEHISTSSAFPRGSSPPRIWCACAALAYNVNVRLI